MHHTVVGVFEHFVQAEDAIRELEKAGIPRNHVSLAAAEAPATKNRTKDESAELTAGAGAGATLGGVAGLVLGLSALAIPGAGPIVAAGPLAAALASAGIGAAAGGFLGALSGMNVPERDAAYSADAVRRGRAVVIVHAQEDNFATARDVLNQCGAQNVNEEGEDARSSEPEAAQIQGSGARVYEAGLEMNPRTSRFEDFSPKPQ